MMNGVSEVQRIILVYLDQHPDKRPIVSQVAQGTGLRFAAVEKALQRLKRKGYITEYLQG